MTSLDNLPLAVPMRSSSNMGTPMACSNESTILFTLSYHIDTLAQQLDDIVSRDLGKHVGILQEGVGH